MRKKKKNQIEQKNRSNRSSDEGYIVDLKSALFLEYFATATQLQCAQVRNGNKGKGKKSQGEEGKIYLSKIRCFHCHEHGHYVTNYPQNKASKKEPEVAAGEALAS